VTEPVFEEQNVTKRVTLVDVLELVTLVADVAFPIRAPVNEGATMPAVEVTMPVEGTMVSPDASVFRTLAVLPLAVDVNNRRALILVAVFAIEMLDPLPVAPVTSPKFNTAADDVPEFVTVAVLPGASVETVPTVTVAAEPGDPVTPWGIP